jgi:hypothetical protein
LNVASASSECSHFKTASRCSRECETTAWVTDGEIIWILDDDYARAAVAAVWIIKAG